jgi:hypothetical protein
MDIAGPRHVCGVGYHDTGEGINRTRTLQILCRKAERFGYVSCTSYIRGFIDGMVVGGNVEELHLKCCPPKDGISVEQGRLIVEKYLKDHPEKLNLEAGYVAAFAFVEAFPCPPKPN